MAPSTNTPLQQKLLDALEALTRSDVAPWPALFTEDGVQEFPYSPEGYPKRLEGRTAIADYLADYPEKFQLDRIVQPVFHLSTGVLVLEFGVEGKGVPTGKPYNQRYISVIEHHDGLITRYVDYWNPLVVMEALGEADARQHFGTKKA